MGDGLERALGRVEGELSGIKGELADLKEGQKGTHARLDRMEDAFNKRFQRLTRSNSNWRWAERLGTFLGAVAAGYWAGKGGQG